jgi:hypothetical protein
MDTGGMTQATRLIPTRICSIKETRVLRIAGAAHSG